MKLIVETLDIDKTRAQWPEKMPFTPALVRERDKDKRHWAVLADPLQPGDEPHWAYAEHDEYLRIPLFPYFLDVAADKALAFMLQLGLSCAGHLPGRVVGLYIVTGTPVEMLTDDIANEVIGLRYWVGFAVITEDT